MPRHAMSQQRKPQPTPRTPHFSATVHLRHPSSGRVLSINADEREFVQALLSAGYTLTRDASGRVAQP